MSGPLASTVGGGSKSTAAMPMRARSVSMVLMSRPTPWFRRGGALAPTSPGTSSQASMSFCFLARALVVERLQRILNELCIRPHGRKCIARAFEKLLYFPDFLSRFRKIDPMFQLCSVIGTSTDKGKPQLSTVIVEQLSSDHRIVRTAFIVVDARFPFLIRE